MRLPLLCVARSLFPRAALARLSTRRAASPCPRSRLGLLWRDSTRRATTHCTLFLLGLLWRYSTRLAARDPLGSEPLPALGVLLRDSTRRAASPCPLPLLGVLSRCSTGRAVTHCPLSSLSSRSPLALLYPKGSEPLHAEEDDALQRDGIRAGSMDHSLGPTSPLSLTRPDRSS